MGKFFMGLITFLVLSIALIVFYFTKEILFFLEMTALFFLSGLVSDLKLKHNGRIRLWNKNAKIIEEIENNRLLDILHLEGFVPSPKEVVFVMQEAEIYIALPPANKTGFFESISIPLPFHLRMNLGKFGIKQRPQYSFVSGGKGRLYLTNERIVFISEFSNENIKYPKVLNIENLNDGVRIDIEGKKPVKFITGDIRFYVTYEKFRREYRNFEHLKAWSKKRP